MILNRSTRFALCDFILCATKGIQKKKKIIAITLLHTHNIDAIYVKSSHFYKI